METFTAPKEMVENPHFKEHRLESLSGLADELIDAPLVEIIDGFNKRPYCFTMQSCYGHFLYPGQKTPDNLDPLPVTASIDRVDYRIAYLAVCIDNSAVGQRFYEALRETTRIDPDYIQFGSAEWFWNRQVNSYALQVEPDRFKHRDRVILDYDEAVHVQKVRNEFFVQVADVLRRLSL
jgi:hypothetical protein